MSVQDAGSRPLLRGAARTRRGVRRRVLGPCSGRDRASSGPMNGPGRIRRGETGVPQVSDVEGSVPVARLPLAAALATGGRDRGHHLLEVLLILLRAPIQLAELLLLGLSPAFVLRALLAVLLSFSEVDEPFVPEV